MSFAVDIIKKFYQKARDVEALDNDGIPYNMLAVSLDTVEDIIAQTIDDSVIQIPCKIGDFAWAIRHYKGIPHPQQGKITEMFFTKDMKLHIVISHIARGEWGKAVFGTEEEARKAIEKEKAEVRSWWR